MDSRLAEKEMDLEFLVGLRNEKESVRFSNRGLLSPQTIENDYFHTPENHAYVVVEEEKKRIGYLICHAKTERRYYISVALIPEMRGKGYGEFMIREAVRLCIENHGAKEVYTDDVHANNTPSIRSMEKVGFKILSREGPKWEMIYIHDER